MVKENGVEKRAGTDETVARQGAEIRSLTHSVDQLRMVVEAERAERKRDFDLIKQEIHNVSLGQQTLASRSGAIDSRTMLTVIAVCLTAFFGSIGVSGTIFGKFRETDMESISKSISGSEQLNAVKFGNVAAAIADIDMGYKSASRDNAQLVGSLRERVASMEQLLSFLRDGWRELKEGQGQISATLFDMGATSKEP